MVNESNENPMSRTVQWRYFLKIPKQNEEMGNSLFFQGTTDEQALHIKELLDINTEVIMESKYQKYIDLLEANKNLILTGAPGTGKTFMAKAIAKEMNAEVSFVQFHPSYDYTDFVEGLRPNNDEDGNVGFERRDGVFKVFCKTALLHFQKDSQTLASLPSMYGNEFGQIYRSIVDDIKSGRLRSYQTPYKIQQLDVKDGRIVFRADSDSPRTESEKNIKLLFDYFVSNHIFDLSALQKDDYWGLIAKLTGGKTKTVDYVEYGWLLQEMLNRATKTYSGTRVIDTNHPDVIPSDEEMFFANRKDEQTKEKFVFIIDEINRGEISKIFGELFFSIDPGYRGEKGKVSTQYQNMIEEGDVFKDGFYVPENVYIIGTMNDIDRSVESMDFAMRRRFAWQEVTAAESYANMIENDSEFALVKDEIKARMFNLNKAITETEGLDEAYQIGAAYFRKYLDYKETAHPFDCLWENHLKGLLFEYLRGNRRAKELLEKLNKAYNNTNFNEQSAHTDEG
jgi:Cdc6-like AAA superfamily ATPase